MQTHDLKVWEEYFEALNSGTKKFELRVNDRNFQVGDVLQLREFNRVMENYTGRIIRRNVTFMVQGVFGLPDNVCVMSIE